MGVCYYENMLDLRETPLYTEESLSRTDYMQMLLEWKDRQVIKVITGVRRSGKSVVMKDFCRELSKTASREQISFLNFEMLENEELLEYHALYRLLKDKLIPDRMNYILLDEIQLVEKFEKVIDSLFVLPNVDIYITGSNANLLSGEIATLLSGRYVELHVLPFSFREFKAGYKKRFPDSNLDSASLYTRFITYGGFPYLHNIYGMDSIVRDYIGGLYATIVLKDIQQRKKISDTVLLEKIVKFTLVHAGNLISPKKICDSFISGGRKTAPLTVENCLNALCESFLFYKLNRYDIKGKETLKTLEKYYAVDMGLRFFMLGARGGDEGHILENLVFLELKRRGYELYVGKADDMEIDFIAKRDGTEMYVQVAISVRDEATLQRELRPLLSVRNNFKKILITLDNAPLTYHDGIKQLYAIDFFEGAEL